MVYSLLTSFSDVTNYILYILLAVLVLLVMITVHEFGHFITGKLLGFKIEEFAIGFGPKIFTKKKKNGEIFSLRAIPFGGFCAFYGEDKEEKDEGAFNNRKPWQRLIVLVSGAIMNYLLSIVVIILLFSCYGYTAVMAYDVERGDLQSRDVILNANDKNIYLLTDLMIALEGESSGSKVPFKIYRQGEVLEVYVTMQEDADFSNVEDTNTLAKVLGLNIKTDENIVTDNGFRSTTIKSGFFSTIGRSFEYSLKLATTIFTIFRQLFTGNLSISTMGGTVTTISVTANAIKMGGPWSLLNIMALIGVNLAVFNLIPFPALDGSRALFVLIEWIVGKPLNRKVENVIHTIGFVALILFAIFIDLQHCF